MARARLTRFEWACLAVVAAAFLVRATFLLTPTVIWDSAWYLTLARSFGETGTFLLPWSDPAAPQYSGYWPPLFPIFLSPLVKLLGADYRVLVLGSILASALLAAAVYACTRDLYDRPRAFAAMALVAANPAFYSSDSKGMSESLLALMVVLTVWAFLRSLDKPAFLPLAAVFAFLAYLGKASLGLPLVVAAALGLGAWRVYTRGWRRVVTSKADVGVALAGALVVAILAATRTERIGGIGVGIIEPLQRAFLGADCSRFTPIESVGPHCWALLLPLKIAFVAAFLLVVTLPFSLRVRDALRAPRTERTDALWLATLLPLVAGAFFTTSFYFTEVRNLIDFDNIRYLTPAMVPFLWLVLPHWPLDAREEIAEGRDVRRRHVRGYALAVGAMVTLLLLHPLAGQPSLGRFVLFLVLSLGPLTLAALVYQSGYVVSERKTPRGVERRYVASRERPPMGVAAPVAALILVAAAWWFSAWYASIGIGLLVALSAVSPRAQAIGMALVLLASAAPAVHSALPVEHAADALARLPEGTLVGMSEQVVFPAAVAPAHVQPRHVDPAAPPEGIDVLLVQNPYIAAGPPPGFHKAEGWAFAFQFSPTLALRVWIEENVLGEVIEYQTVEGLALYVRNGTAADALYS